MRILYAGMKYDYGDHERGLSFEHWNFYESLKQMGYEIIYFDFMTLYKQRGRRWMNRRLWEMVKAEQPDLLFSVLFQEEFERKTIRKISHETNTITLNWFTDDHWRFENFSQYWAPQFNWVVTTASSALPKYAGIGYPNVIKSQWGFNHILYRNLDLPNKYDVTFIGQPHGDRKQVIEALKLAGIDVHVWGHGWESGRLDQDAMIRIFNQSRINLNLSNASTIAVGKPQSVITWRAKEWIRARIRKHGFLGALKNRIVRLRPREDVPVKTLELPDQIKGRNFEIPGCGGFLLTGKSDNLEQYFRIDDEVVCFGGTDDLIAKTKYFLAHETERARIADAGFRRSMREHTYENRFSDIFQQIGL